MGAQGGVLERQGGQRGLCVDAFVGYGSQPDNPDAWEKASKAITEQLLDWVNEASAGIAFDPDNLKLTSVHASGTTGLLQIGADANRSSSAADPWVA